MENLVGLELGEPKVVPPKSIPEPVKPLVMSLDDLMSDRRCKNASNSFVKP